MSAPAQTSQTQSVTPGVLFGVPVVTKLSEQKENNDGTSTTLSQTSQVNHQFSSPFKQTDVVKSWRLDVTWTNTITAGSSTITTAEWFPFNILGAVELNMQNLFSTIRYLSGIDAVYFQMLRPQYSVYPANVMDQGTTGNAYSTQPDLKTATNYTSSSTTIKFSVDLMPGIFFDEYWSIDSSGMPLVSQAGLVPPIRTYVGWQFMSSTMRVVQPRVQYNSISAATLDNAPFNIGAGSGTGAGSVQLNIRRKVVLQPQGTADSPMPIPWQYTRETQLVSLAGVAAKDIAIVYPGQILSIGVRLFDPSANSGLGASIDVTTAVKEVDLTFAGGLIKYQDTARDAQLRFFRQHGFLLPKGFLAWDMAIDEQGRVTNANALITLNTSGVNLHFDFNSTLSGTAYCVLLFEGLKLVANG